jgi:hypothetical protein
LPPAERIDAKASPCFAELGYSLSLGIVSLIAPDKRRGAVPDSMLILALKDGGAACRLG